MTKRRNSWSFSNYPPCKKQKLMDKDLKEEMMELIKEKERVFKENIDSLFCTPFYGNVNEILFNLCEQQIKETSKQKRNFIALAQASMSGKTRLLFEISLKHPLIIIAFKDGVTFRSFINIIQVHEKVCCSFSERQFHNRIIMLKIRLFLLSHLKFLKMYLECKQKSWEDLNLEEKKIINMLLFNGGNTLLNNIFEDLLKEKNLPVEYTENNQKFIENLPNLFLREYLELSNSLGSPWLAFDECHVLSNNASGKLFHSNYHEMVKEYGEEIVLEWQKYEETHLSSRIQPTGYPYKMKTSLFSGFRWILEELLLQDSNPILSIFASTVYSCWGEIADPDNYSRQKPQMELFQHQYVLSEENIINSLQFLIPDSKIDYSGLDFSIWRSRPGFFFDCAWSGLKNSKNLRDIIKGLDTGKKIAVDKLNRLFEHSKDKNDILKNILYFDLMYDSRITNDKKREDIINAGLAIFSEEECIIKEPIVREFIKFKLDQLKYDICDTMINLQQKTSQLAEFAIALQLIRKQGSCSIADWLNSLNCDTVLQKDISSLLSSCYIHVTKCTSIDYAVKSGSIDDYFCIFDEFCCKNVYFPPNTKKFPDLLFISNFNNENCFYCFVSIQHKLYDKKNLDDKGFIGAVESTSIDHFFKNHDKNKIFPQKWQEILKSDEIDNILHVRIIICWNGFSSKQIKSINNHNQLYPFQPIILISVKEKNVVNIYGEKVANHFKSEGYSIIPKRVYNVKSLYPQDTFKMNLSEKEEDFSKWL